MKNQPHHRSIISSLAAAAFAAALLRAANAQARAEHQTTQANWHPQQAVLGNVGLVDDSEATLVRNGNGVRYRLNTSGLQADHAYTLWLVVVNEPGACANHPCAATDVFDPATRSQVSYAAGHVGRGTFAGHVGVGPLDGWLPDRALEDASSAEIHLVINDHGPIVPGMVANMIHTYRGGCSDASPFPGLFPATALADGEVGPNICRLYQSAIFLAA